MVNDNLTAFILRFSNQWPKCFTILPNIHPFMHTFGDRRHARRGSVVGSCTGRPQHSGYLFSLSLGLPVTADHEMVEQKARYLGVSFIYLFIYYTALLDAVK